MKSLRIFAGVKLGEIEKRLFQQPVKLRPLILDQVGPGLDKGDSKMVYRSWSTGDGITMRLAIGTS